MQKNQREPCNRSVSRRGDDNDDDDDDEQSQKEKKSLHQRITGFHRTITAG